MLLSVFGCLQTPRYSYSHDTIPVDTYGSLLVHTKDRHRPQDICECVYKIPCKNCNKTYIGKTGRAFGVRLQEHQQEVSQRDVWAHTRSTSRSLTGEQNKSAVTDHAISLNHVIHRVPKKHVTTFSTITLTISVRLQ